MILKIKYRDDVQMYDIITIDNGIEKTKYVVISISYEEIALEPVSTWVMRNSLVMYDGRYQSIMELVNDKSQRLVGDRDRGLTTTWEDMI